MNGVLIHDYWPDRNVPFIFYGHGGTIMVSITISNTCKLSLQVDCGGTVTIARVCIDCMPLQPRVLYPTSDDIRSLLANYGYSICRWADTLSPDALAEASKFGILSERWYTEHVFCYF